MRLVAKGILLGGLNVGPPVQAEASANALQRRHADIEAKRCFSDWEMEQLRHALAVQRQRLVADLVLLRGSIICIQLLARGQDDLWFV